MIAKKRVLIIGMDGFTWRLGRDFMSEGVMPNLANLVNNGTHGILWSVMPFETSPAWSSFQTGCLPGQTNIFAFHRYDRNLKKISLNSFADNAMPSLWELLDRAGLRAISLNMPVSSPPPKINGIIIPGLLCPKLSPETVHPPEAYNKYIKPQRNYLIVNNRFQDTVKEFAQQSIATEKTRTQVALELMQAENWDVFCIQMQSSDAMQHRTWDALDQTAKGHSPEQRKEALPFYRFCDDAIGRLVAAAGQETLTLIASDHGFCQAKGFFAINLWLRQRGYLHLLPKKETNWEITKRKIPPLKMLARLYGSTIQKFSNDDKKKLYCEELLSHLRRILDFEKTRAFCLGGMAGILYINGTKQQRIELAQQIKEELLNDFGPGTQKPVIDRITTGEETYGLGKDSDSLPDLVVQYQEGYVTKIYPLGDVIVASDVYPGTHGRDGVLVANGPGIREGAKLDGNIVDIVPTVLAYLGVPVPSHVDGKVLSKAFDEPPSVQYEDITRDNSLSTEYTDEEQARVEDQLSGLGYL
ncbi:MAG: alkaline phosphatase family protein [Sedimentisphaerales bacterium]|nr:alkaline phosphatase family protein [Sedimentisphaerales bacterium]